MELTISHQDRLKLKNDLYISLDRLYEDTAALVCLDTAKRSNWFLMQIPHTTLLPCSENVARIPLPCKPWPKVRSRFT